jgi:hypothetical protein
VSEQASKKALPSGITGEEAFERVALALAKDLRSSRTRLEVNKNEEDVEDWEEAWALF